MFENMPTFLKGTPIHIWMLQETHNCLNWCYHIFFPPLKDKADLSGYSIRWTSFI